MRGVMEEEKYKIWKIKDVQSEIAVIAEKNYVRKIAGSVKDIFTESANG